MKIMKKTNKDPKGYFIHIKVSLHFVYIYIFIQCLINDFFLFVFKVLIVHNFAQRFYVVVGVGGLVV